MRSSKRPFAAILATAALAAAALVATEAQAQCDPSTCSDPGDRAAYARAHCPSEKVVFVPNRTRKFRLVRTSARGASRGGLYVCESAARKTGLTRW